MIKELKYGEKRDYRKIDLILDGVYVATTTWSKNLREAKSNAIKYAPLSISPRRLKARYSGVQGAK